MIVSEKPLIRLYNGDCMPALEAMDENQYDLCLTDPPYGVGFDYSTYDDTESNWFELINKFIPLIRKVCSMSIMPSMQIAKLPFIYTNHAPNWLICWYKGSPGHRSHIGFNDWEPLLVYGKIKGLQMHDYFYCQPEVNGKNIDHPCPKPVLWYKRLYSKVSPLKKIRCIEPFGGSMAAAIAAYDLGFDLDLWELDEDYFKAGVDRVQKHIAQGQLFNPAQSKESGKQLEI